jgi:hypothetical protein
MTLKDLVIKSRKAPWAHLIYYTEKLILNVQKKARSIRYKQLENIKELFAKICEEM